MNLAACPATQFVTHGALRYPLFVTLGVERTTLRATAALSHGAPTFGFGAPGRTRAMRSSALARTDP